MIKWGHKEINQKIQQAIQSPAGMMGQPITLVDRLRMAGQRMMGGNGQKPQIPMREM